MPASLAQLRIEIARAERFSRRGTGDPGAVEAARRDYAAGQIEDVIRRVLVASPQPSEAQLDRLASLLRSGGGHDA